MRATGQSERGQCREAIGEGARLRIVAAGKTVMTFIHAHQRSKAGVAQTPARSAGLGRKRT